MVEAHFRFIGFTPRSLSSACSPSCSAFFRLLLDLIQEQLVMRALVMGILVASDVLLCLLLDLVQQVLVMLALVTAGVHLPRVGFERQVAVRVMALFQRHGTPPDGDQVPRRLGRIVQRSTRAVVVCKGVATIIILIFIIFIFIIVIFIIVVIIFIISVVVIVIIIIVVIIFIGFTTVNIIVKTHFAFE